jgi:antitoxin component YwqK of YwqJK toxin-antitoxin module
VTMTLVKTRYIFGAYKEERSYRKDNPQILDGESRFYYIGDLQVMTQEFYTDGKLDGKRTVWYENGMIRDSQSYRSGVQEGEHKMWAQNGELLLHEFYLHGKLEGKRKLWKGEKLWIREFYRAGQRQGELIYHNRVTEYSYFQDGTPIDLTFRKKKYIFLKLRKHLYSRRFSTSNFPIIPDLLKLALGHC